MSATVDKREQQDRKVFAEKSIGQNAADDRKEVGACHEQMHRLPRLCFGHEVGLAG